MIYFDNLQPRNQGLLPEYLIIVNFGNKKSYRDAYCLQAGTPTILNRYK